MIDQRSYTNNLGTVKLKPEIFILFYFFQALISQLLNLCASLTAMVNYVLISFSAVQIYDPSYCHLYSSPSTGIL